MKQINVNRSYLFPIELLINVMVGMLMWRILFIYFNDVEVLFPALRASFRLDISMTGGFFLLCYIPYIAYMVSGKQWLIQVLKWEMIAIWILMGIVEMSSILLYKEWGSTLDNRAVSYLSNPTEMWASVKSFIPWPVIITSLLIIGVGIWRITTFFKEWQPIRRKYILSWSYLLIIGLLSFVAMRGGLQKIVITPSDAFVFKDMKVNFAATNKMWYFLYSINKSGKLQTRNNIKEIKDFETRYQEDKCLYSDRDGLWKDKNIVLIVLEGWSADMVQYLYAQDRPAPFFDSLSRQSIRFKNAFSTGFRTDQGLASVLSGVPSMQGTNILKKLEKVRELPSLPRALKETGRSTSFIYGGDLNFANLYNFLNTLSFDTIIGQQSFDNESNASDWGVPDHIVAKKAIEIINQQSEPFFSNWLLLSSHAPFDVPIPNPFTGGKDVPSKYKSSVMYSDSALRSFFDSAKIQPWYQNTIFILTSDHGSTHSGWAGMDDHNRFRIPMIVFDPAHTVLDTMDISTPCNHFDLPATICKLVGTDASPFIYSRNVFCDEQNRAAWWSNDVVAGKYDNLNNSTQPVDGLKSIENNEPVLFLDMIKHWFNNL